MRQVFHSRITRDLRDPCRGLDMNSTKCLAAVLHV